MPMIPKIEQSENGELGLTPTDTRTLVLHRMQRGSVVCLILLLQLTEACRNTMQREHRACNFFFFPHDVEHRG